MNDSAPRGQQDVQTVTPEGASVLPTIDGVETRSPVVHLDHRGALYEIFNGDPAAWPEPAVYVYESTVRVGQIKGWAAHDHKVDRYTLTHGEVLVLLHDGREGSPTYGVTQPVPLAARGVRQLRIPAGVWHLLINVGQEEVHLVNLPTEPYDHAEPDRRLLPWDSDDLGVDVRAYLPKF